MKVARSNPTTSALKVDELAMHQLAEHPFLLLIMQHTGSACAAASVETVSSGSAQLP